MTGRTRVHVVVDTWNLRRQANDVLGYNRFPTMQGIKKHLASIGLDVVHVYAAVSCDSYSPNPSKRVREALSTSQSFVDEVEACQFATLLRGKLTDRSGELEEKLVDVLCAVQICRSAMEIITGAAQADAIVVISEDIDLTPAFVMARKLGVPVYAMANETVHTRPGDWIVIGDSAMEAMCGRPTSEVGYALKSVVAKQLTSARTSRRYKVRYVHSNTKQVHLRHRTGAEVVHSGTGMQKNTSHELYPSQAHMVDGQFPAIIGAADQPSSDVAMHVEIGSVSDWVQPTRVRIQCADGAVKTMEAAPGTLFPGMPVAIFAQPSKRPRLIGALESLPHLNGWKNPTAPKLACVTGSADSPGKTVTAEIQGIGEVALLPPGDHQPAPGEVFAVVPRAVESDRVVKVMAISTALPALT